MLTCDKNDNSTKPHKNADLKEPALITIFLAH